MTIFKSSIATGNLLFSFSIPTILFIVTVCLEIDPDKTKHLWKRFSKRAKIILCFILLMGGCVIGFKIDTYEKIVVPYQRGEYQVIKGEVQDYTPAATIFNAYETFRIDDVFFAYGGGRGKNYFGYDKTGIEGGAITSNGIYVEIGYVTYRGNNIIVQLDIPGQ